MTESCPIPTPEQARCQVIIEAARDRMLEAVAAAITEAHETSAREIGDTPIGPPPPRDFFVAVTHHRLFLELCHADPDTSAGGRTTTAAAILRNFERLAKTWEERNNDEATGPHQ